MKNECSDRDPHRTCREWRHHGSTCISTRKANMTRLAPDVARAPEHVISVTRDALQRLARDLRWTWHREAASLFRDLDPEGWEASGHNPEWLLQQLSTSSLRAVL